MDFVPNDILEVATAFATLDVDARVQLEETIVTALAYGRQNGNVSFEDASDNTITGNNAVRIREKLIPAVESFADKIERDLIQPAAEDLATEIDRLRSLVGLQPRGPR